MLRILNPIKNIRTLRPYLYDALTWRRKVMPRPLAGFLGIGNRPSLPGTLRLPTYDGSGQACHPTVSVFQGKIYMACTPYPYGRDPYENPCLYVRGPDSARWKPVPGVYPLVRPQRPGYEHYSDPCLFQREGKLVLLYRKRERRPSGTVEILYTVSSADGEAWDPPRFLAEGPVDDRLISPAAAGNALFCVEYYGGSSQIVRYALDGLDGLGEKTACGVSGLGQDFFVWHMDCATQPDGAVRGLFMLQKKNVPEIISRLALFTWRPGDGVWSWERDVPESEEEKRAVSFVYKSCFTEDPGRVLCSARDRKGRFFLFEKSI